MPVNCDRMLSVRVNLTRCRCCCCCCCCFWCCCYCCRCNKKMYLKRAEAESTLSPLPLSPSLSLSLLSIKTYIKSRLLTHPILLLWILPSVLPFSFQPLWALFLSISFYFIQSTHTHTAFPISPIHIRDISLSFVFVVSSFTVCFFSVFFWLTNEGALLIYAGFDFSTKILWMQFFSLISLRVTLSYLTLFSLLHWPLFLSLIFSAA